MKKILSFFTFIIVILLVVYYQKPITSFILKEFVYQKELSTYKTNNYTKQIDYDYVKVTNSFYPKNEEDIKNAIYTVLNSGMTDFSLFCDDNYDNCLKDVEKISTDYEILSNFNTLVHPYNSYNKFYVTTNAFGKININVEKLYTDAEIEEINAKIENIKSQILTPYMTDRDKIKAFHDYIITNTVYDSERSEALTSNGYSVNINNSHKANGVLNNHVALCSGYTDLMAIFLSSIDIPNFKIANKQHIWNAVYLDGTWYHLDLTWDDPVTSTGEDLLIYDFFLITTSELEQMNTNQHEYDKTVYGF